MLFNEALRDNRVLCRKLQCFERKISQNIKCQLYATISLFALLCNDSQFFKTSKRKNRIETEECRFLIIEQQAFPQQDIFLWNHFRERRTLAISLI